MTESSRGPAGVLPSQAIRQMIAEGAIAADAPIPPGQVQPASLDLRLGTTAYRVRASFLPGAGRTVSERLADFAMHAVDLTEGAALETGCVYLVPLMERLRLPTDVAGAANAKSSTGRLDLFTRVIADGGTEFDRVDAGYDGPLWAEISPRTFSVLARAGERLTQIRFRRGRPALSPDQSRRVHGAAGEAGLPFSVDLAGAGAIGWRARPHSGLIDLAKLSHYAAEDFWDPVRLGPGRAVILDPGAFYILASRESVQVPPDCAAEMAPYLAVMGEFRVHYAGFFDPGFGMEEAGGAGSRAVLEVRCHESPFALEHGQEVGRLVYEPMTEPPDILYGRDIGSTYQAQGLRLSKHFRTI
jgi:dCTP deaminase